MRMVVAPVTLAAVAVLAAGCGSASGSRAATGSGSQAQHVSATRTVDEHAAGTTVRLHTGDRLRVVLHSTYWRFGSPRGGVLSATGSPQVSPAPRGSCRPGQGCGQVVASFSAAGPGTATVTATRDSCGEAMRCTGGAGSYAVKVVVTG